MSCHSKMEYLLYIILNQQQSIFLKKFESKAKLVLIAIGEWRFPFVVALPLPTLINFNIFTIVNCNGLIL